MSNIFIVGFGNIGHLVAAKCLESGANVTALVRSRDSGPHLQGHGVKNRFGDLDHPDTLDTLNLSGTIVYYFAPPPSQGDHDTRMHHFIASITPHSLPQRIIYISTSGVYGDTRGAWVTETSPVNPQTARARRRLDAENTLRQFGLKYEVPVIIFRVGGIYGPGRLPRERLEQGLPVLNENECGFTNRIHTDDLVNILCLAREKGRADNVYNVSDCKPGTMTQYFFAVADALGLPRPPTLSLEEAPQQLSPAMLSYLSESRRMDNRKLLEEFDLVLSYPDLESGIKSIIP